MIAEGISLSSRKVEDRVVTSQPTSAGSDTAALALSATYRLTSPCCCNMLLVLLLAFPKKARKPGLGRSLLLCACLKLLPGAQHA